MSNSEKFNTSQKLLTLKEMAHRLNRCERTFRKYVDEYGIPHIRLGRDLLFNHLEVESFLKNKTAAESVAGTRLETKTKSAQTSKTLPRYQGNRFASLLELD